MLEQHSLGKKKVVGITTAASLWVTAAIGLTLGIGEYALAITATLLILLILFSGIIFKRNLLKEN